MKHHGDAGFTLLEVLIAVAILAITLTVLYGSQSQSLSLAVEAKFNTKAAFLLEEKIAEILAGEVEMYNGEGDFGEENPQFSWKIEVEEVDVTEPEFFEEVEDLKKVSLTVFWQDSPFSRSVILYYYDKE